MDDEFINYEDNEVRSGFDNTKSNIDYFEFKKKENRRSSVAFDDDHNIELKHIEYPEDWKVDFLKQIHDLQIEIIEFLEQDRPVPEIANDGAPDHLVKRLAEIRARTKSMNYIVCLIFALAIVYVVLLLSGILQGAITRDCGDATMWDSTTNAYTLATSQCQTYNTLKIANINNKEIKFLIAVEVINLEIYNCTNVTVTFPRLLSFFQVNFTQSRRCFLDAPHATRTSILYLQHLNNSNVNLPALQNVSTSLALGNVLSMSKFYLPSFTRGNRIEFRNSDIVCVEFPELQTAASVKAISMMKNFSMAMPNLRVIVYELVIKMCEFILFLNFSSLHTLDTLRVTFNRFSWNNLGRVHECDTNHPALVSFNAIADIGVALIEHNVGMTLLYMDSMIIADAIQIYNNVGLCYLSFSQLEVTQEFSCMFHDSLETLRLPEVRVVDRLYLMSNAYLGVISLPSVEMVIEIIVSMNYMLNTVQLDSLTSGSISFVDNPVLSSISFDKFNQSSVFVVINSGLKKLETVIKSISWHNGPRQPLSAMMQYSLSLYHLDAANEPSTVYAPMIIARNNNLEILSLMELSNLDNGMLVDNNPFLTQLSLPSLETIGNARYYTSFNSSIFNNANIQTIQSPSLTDINALSIYNNPNLESILMPNLHTTLKHLIIFNDSKLCIGPESFPNNRPCENIFIDTDSIDASCFSYTCNKWEDGVSDKDQDVLP